jgi:dCMP deaminase
MEPIQARPSSIEYFLMMASLVSIRGTCPRRRVGCVLVDKFNHVLATGYNGVPASLPHCIDHPCPGAGLRSGEGLEKCLSIHAEQNALLQCRDCQIIESCFCTDSPCITCTKLLLNTSCKRIIFIREYPHPEAKELWTRVGREWTQSTSTSWGGPTLRTFL